MFYRISILITEITEERSGSMGGNYTETTIQNVDNVDAIEEAVKTALKLANKIYTSRARVVVVLHEVGVGYIDESADMGSLEVKLKKIELGCSLG